MVIDFDIDLETGLPPWDLYLMYQGVRVRVRPPTAREFSRLMDLRNGTQEQATIGFQQVLSALTGIDRSACESLGYEKISEFFSALTSYVVKRLEIKTGLKRQLPTVSLPPSSGVNEFAN